jgi:hypothetical protein
MKQRSSTRRGLRQLALAASLAAGLGLAAGTALAEDGINPYADEILRAMSDYMGGTKSLSFEADVSNEVITVEGQKLQFNSHATVELERPSHFRIKRTGRFADVALSYDGAEMSLYGKELNAHIQKPLAGTIDDALREFERSTGLPLPGVDLLLLNSYAALTGEVTSSGYYGTDWIDGVECHHLAFRTPKIDFQVWVEAGEHPLPRKYVITTKWTTGAPQYSVQLRNWNTQPQFGSERFQFVPPEGSLKIDVLPVDDTGEVVLPEEGK